MQTSVEGSIVNYLAWVLQLGFTSHASGFKMHLASAKRHPALSPYFYGAPAPLALQLRSLPWGTQPERRVAKQRGARACANAHSPHSAVPASTKALLRSKRRR
ncbi:hypothetical protein NDU88_007127 [Pleurodeles waltl]|uniref:Uncharacterized protein n=1 Tax=Pleurodeles waltl TaxID=8319 RepID=A0AAV7QJZ2_PLEWA|nr:hypothetical protein NDU88_007127 [Pleurodeles waltl]